MDKNTIIASQIVEEILPLFWNWRLWESGTDESGITFKLYGEKSEAIHKELVKLLDEKCPKIEEK